MTSTLQHSIAVVIPTYNMAWCIGRAVASCLSQTHAPAEIVIVDDCSQDNTAEVLRDLLKCDNRICLYRLPYTKGHLSALLHGLQSCRSNWVALLDADDELVADSLERRIYAAEKFHARAGEWPQLIYGDRYLDDLDPKSIDRFKRIHGHQFSFLCRELSLCQTSTIMLGREAISRFPQATNPYNTDDEIVLAVGKYFPVTHAGSPVVVCHSHGSVTRMSNNSRRIFCGIRQLVHDHRNDIVRHHGVSWLFLWHLRVMRALLEWQDDWAKQVIKRYAPSGLLAKIVCFPLRLYGWLTRRGKACLTYYLKRHFEQVYF